MSAHASPTLLQSASSSLAAETLPTLVRVLEHLVRNGDKAMAASPLKEPSPFFAVRPPSISIGNYLDRAVRYAVCKPECFVIALILIDRIKQHNKGYVICSTNIHRLLITSLLLASKFYDDVYYNNAYFARVGGISVEEMNGLELDFLFLIKFALFIEEREYDRYLTELLKHSKTAPRVPAATYTDAAVRKKTQAAPAPAAPAAAVEEEHDR
eukprot:CAMPEP_0177646510 /NCGR_PEP_ID=MMETSP0447-20121125/9811_1 /TAXON_ID=0 /ORGANISM="Stygamoeba regulata, Strain BSH-02190019" /LENGTH=211 /DNA_ID=CAMNT_0019149045 /DNA_START=636 /DNA_END=1271 /DNA_ORIENTATION=+